MAIDVSKPSSSDYPTKPTPPVSPPPYRDRHHNNNQTIPTTTAKDRPDPPSFSVSEDDFHKTDQDSAIPPGFSDASDDDDDDPFITPDMFDFDPTSEMTTATTTGTTTTAAMTFEEYQQLEDEHYEAEDRAEEAAWPTSKWILLVAALNADIFAPIGTFDTDPTPETPTHTPTMIEEESDPPADNIRCFFSIEEAAEQQQQTRHTQSKDRPVPVISNKNTNKNKKKKKKKKIQKKATLKMTHMPTIIEEEEEVPSPPGMFDSDSTIEIVLETSEAPQPKTRTPPKTTQVPMIIEQEDKEERVPLLTTNSLLVVLLPKGKKKKKKKKAKKRVPLLMANLLLRLLQFKEYDTTTCITTTIENATTDATTITGTITIPDTSIESHATRETEEEVSTTIVITEPQRNSDTTNCTYYYDNIDKEIKRSLPNANTHTNTDTSTITNNQSPTTTEASDLAQVLISIVELIEEDTVEYAYGILSEDPFDDDIREIVRGILMETLMFQFGVDGVVVCDSLFALLDFAQQQQRDTTTTTANTPPIASPLTKSRPATTTNTTSTMDVNIIEDESYTEKSNNYYDNIDNEILHTEYEGTIVFEDCVDDTEPTTENVVTANSNNNINIAQRLAEDVGQAATCAAEREQREEDRVDKAQVHEEERAAERAQRKEERADRTRVREEERARNGQKRARWLDELKTCLTTGCPPINNSPASTSHTCIEIPSETTSETTKEEPTTIKSITNTSNSNKYHTINLQVAHRNTVSYDKWRQQQEQQQAQTLQKQNAYWDAECYRQLAAADKEANRTYDESQFDSNSVTHQTIPPTMDWNDDEGNVYNNEYDDDDIEYDFEDDKEDDEYDSDHQMYTKNDTIDSIVDTSYIENTPIHTTDITDMDTNNMNTTTEISTLTQPTNTIIESPIHSEINIIEDEDKYDPNNSIKNQNAAKRKEKASRRKNAVSIRRTENTIRNKFFEFLDHKGSNDSDSSSSECNCDLHHDCPKHRWEHWSQRTFSYDKTYNYDRVDPVETYMLDGQDHWYFNSYIPRMLGGTMPH